MKLGSAENLALEMLGWLVGNEELLPVFLGSTGLDGPTLRARAGEADVLTAVLDFVMMDDAWVRDWAQATGHPPTAAMQARHAFPGAEQVNWT